MRLTRGPRGEKRGGNDEGNKAYQNCQIRARYRRDFARLSREKEADAVALPVVFARTKSSRAVLSRGIGVNHLSVFHIAVSHRRV